MLFEQLQIGSKQIHLAPLATGDFFQYPELLQISNQFVSRGWLYSCCLSHPGGINHWTLIQVMKNLLCICCSAAQRLYLVIHLLLQLEDVVKSGDAVFGCFNNSHQKKLEPLQQVVLLSLSPQFHKIMHAVALEKIRKIQHGLLQYSLADQIQGNEQAPYPAITIQKWVDGFKLIMHQGNF